MTRPNPSQRGQAPERAVVAEQVAARARVVGPARLHRQPRTKVQASHCHRRSAGNGPGPWRRPSRSSRAAARARPCRGPGGRRSHRRRASLRPCRAARPSVVRRSTSSLDPRPGSSRLRASDRAERRGRYSGRTSSGNGDLVARARPAARRSPRDGRRAWPARPARPQSQADDLAELGDRGGRGSRGSR